MVWLYDLLGSYRLEITVIYTGIILALSDNLNRVRCQLEQLSGFKLIELHLHLNELHCSKHAYIWNLIEPCHIKRLIRKYVTFHVAKWNVIELCVYTFSVCCRFMLFLQFPVCLKPNFELFRFWKFHMHKFCGRAVWK